MTALHALMLIAALVSASEEESVAMVFFRHLAAGEGEAAAEMFAEDALSNVTPMLNALKDGLRAGDPGFIERLERCGYAAGPQEMLEWNEREYLARTLSLPMVAMRYSRFDSAYVCSTEVSGGEASVFLCLQVGESVAARTPVSLARVRGSWRVTNFMGIYSFP